MNEVQFLSAYTDMKNIAGFINRNKDLTIRYQEFMYSGYIYVVNPIYIKSF